MLPHPPHQALLLFPAGMVIGCVQFYFFYFLWQINKMSTHKEPQRQTHLPTGHTMWSSRFMSAQAMGILVLVVVMLVTGSVNTLSKVGSHSIIFLHLIHLSFIFGDFPEMAKPADEPRPLR
jgi:hypothetical protein